MDEGDEGQDAIEEPNGAAPEGVEIIEPDEEDEFDEIFGDGSDLAAVEMLDDSALSRSELRLWELFCQKLDSITLETCSTCHERFRS